MKFLMSMISLSIEVEPLVEADHKTYIRFANIVRDVIRNHVGSILTSPNDDSMDIWVECPTDKSEEIRQEVEELHTLYSHLFNIEIIFVKPEPPVFTKEGIDESAFIELGGEGGCG